MDKALSPYVKGGGAKKYEEELKNMYGMDGSMDSTVGGFQAMTQDMLTVLNDIPFSIPPYFALLARAVVASSHSSPIALARKPRTRIAAHTMSADSWSVALLLVRFWSAWRLAASTLPYPRSSFERPPRVSDDSGER